ncbi:MAG: alpha/beta hydrolase [Mogibacterium sp.]|nr:alpha/beta hydrolase [Mogibacterium sp.]
MKTALMILLILIALTLLLACVLASKVVTGKRQTLEEAMQWQSDHYDTSFYTAVAKTNYAVCGYGNYVLHVEALRNPVPTDKYVIITHGYTDNHIGSLKYAKMYLDLGYNCILYDIRGHGENERTYTTYGVLESQDLLCLIEDTRTRYPRLTELGLHGESLGAATTVTVMKYRPAVDFAVADCGFSDIWNVLEGAFKDMHIPAVFLNLADLGSRLRYRQSLKAMRPIDSLDDNQVPILFIHGAADSFILPKNSQDMSDRTQGLQQIQLIEDADHAMSMITDPERYREYVEAFLDEVHAAG